MEFKVVATRGDGIYIVQQGDLFYLVNLEVDHKPQSSEYIDKFLRFGYFTEVTEVDEETLNQIKQRISNS